MKKEKQAQQQVVGPGGRGSVPQEGPGPSSVHRCVRTQIMYALSMHPAQPSRPVPARELKSDVVGRPPAVSHGPLVALCPVPKVR